ncbi:hypothetical protein IP91_04060 [Pseudoduganella lurida]|uniref:CobQ/CobB/MinD/ParA nucleotide binding domain-containing protein n=1 Tax=Pseudoduganella lurida TaxID=1036180 RepID=A0A562R246_9BURK|nr:conjugal transfer protein TraL [Pseudoduganella lurida]TWI62540.1 hypothetical protein IP91_04060 [Pseudoduganella lurida]
MATIHMTLQGKGGVGKSLAAVILAQYKIAGGAKPLCIDTDPVNATFHGYQALDVQRLPIMEDDEINTRKFDLLIQLFGDLAQPAIVDNGASSFVPLSHYLISNEIPALLAGMGHQLVVHTVITGGQCLLDTVSGFSHLLGQFPRETSFVVWLNPFWGPVEDNGKGFEQMKAYQAHRDRVAAIVHMPVLKEETYGRDLSDMLQQRQTFDEALALSSLTIMTRQRLTIIRRNFFQQLDNVPVL